ncbi:uncharacterized protein C11orf94 homolog isoform X1 [Phyllostomus discolor]|uniref:Uncharacterized protein C11orf94 homolog isoform X1 n=1 Tax=Phyllostomus discolor TaxID=89673 RepID=A0A7E6E1M0_9CHIR|nr:uncharacterized protein C11orf94 homolog isoform X1 [Phyllostomus discolor]
MRKGWCEHPGLSPASEGAIVVFRASTEHPNISHRPQRSVSEDSEAPLELPQPLSGLLDDYGIRPKHPLSRGPRPLLSQAQQRKREDPDMADYYYDTRL